VKDHQRVKPSGEPRWGTLRDGPTVGELRLGIPGVGPQVEAPGGRLPVGPPVRTPAAHLG
jgi:hypothetical protein